MPTIGRAIPVGKPIAWSPEDDALLMHEVSEGSTFRQIGRRLGISQTSVHHRFEKLRKQMGWQAV